MVPALEEIFRLKWLPMLDRMVEVLLDGRKSSHGEQATIRVALDFFTWQVLDESGVAPDAVVNLAASWVEAGSKA